MLDAIKALVLDIANLDLQHIPFMPMGAFARKNGEIISAYLG